MSLKILQSGLLTTIQDLGRTGHQKDGIMVSGAMDAFALRIGNLLVGNPEGQAGLEATFLGPRIRFEADHLIAITGGDLSPTINGEKVGMWRPILVPQGSLLEFGTPRLGCRAYLAVAGGFILPKVLGSYATYQLAELGGLKGRALKAGDILPGPGPGKKPSRLWQHLLKARINRGGVVQTSWSPAGRFITKMVSDPEIRAVRGPEYELFTPESRQDFWEKPFIVTSDSDRMGYRLQGTKLLLSEPRELLSSAVAFGTIQVPAEGSPIALLADHQTTGGYPRIGQVVTADFSLLAQVAMGRRIRFREVSLAEAQEAYIQHEKNIGDLKRAIAFRVNQ